VHSLHITPHKQRKWKLTSEELLSRVGLQSLHHYIDLKVLGHAGHVERMEGYRLPKLVRDEDIDGNNTPGGQWKTHRKCILQSLRRKRIAPGDWKSMDVLKDSWREKIRAIMDGPGARITGATAKKISDVWEKRKTSDPFDWAPSA
jgi:hypothetical protein